MPRLGFFLLQTIPRSFFLPFLPRIRASSISSYPSSPTLSSSRYVSTDFSLYFLFHLSSISCNDLCPYFGISFLVLGYLFRLFSYFFTYYISSHVSKKSKNALNVIFFSSAPMKHMYITFETKIIFFFVHRWIKKFEKRKKIKVMGGTTQAEPAKQPCPQTAGRHRRLLCRHGPTRQGYPCRATPGPPIY